MKHTWIRSKLISSWKSLNFLVYNLWASRKITPIPKIHLDGYVFSGLQRNQIAELDYLYGKLKNGKSLNVWKKILLRYRGTKLCWIVTACDGQIVGFHMLRLNRKEYAQKIVRVEYSGLIPEARGKGLTSGLKEHALEYILSNGFKGFTATIRSSNTAVVKVAERYGFKVIREFGNEVKVFRIYWELEA